MPGWSDTTPGGGHVAPGRGGAALWQGDARHGALQQLRSFAIQISPEIISPLSFTRFIQAFNKLSIKIGTLAYSREGGKDS
jgi:hypothetical protein